MRTRTLFLICDNRPFLRGYLPSWGLSLGVREEGEWTLFDLGNSPEVFLHNFTRSGGDLKQVRRIILSHLHHDHAGGLAAFSLNRRPVELYLPEPIPPEDIRQLNAYHFDVKIVPPKGIQTGKFQVFPVPGGDPPEQLLIMENGEGLGILTGCAHYGIENGLLKVRERFKRPITLVCGGFHLAFRPDEETEQVLNVFYHLSVEKIAPCHCTGDRAIERFRQRFPNRFLRVGAGWRLTL